MKPGGRRAGDVERQSMAAASIAARNRLGESGTNDKLLSCASKRNPFARQANGFPKRPQFATGAF